MYPNHCAVIFAGSPALCWRTQNLSLLAVSFVSGSPICHCAFEYDGVVVDINVDTGLRYVPADEYIDNHPCLQAVVQTPCYYGINPDYFQPLCGASIPRIPALLHWLDFGCGKPPYTCTTISKLSLQACGINVPCGLSTPADLFRWLVHGGYPYATAKHREFKETAKRYIHSDYGSATGGISKTHSRTQQVANRIGTPETGAGIWALGGM